MCVCVCVNVYVCVHMCVHVFVSMLIGYTPESADGQLPLISQPMERVRLSDKPMDVSGATASAATSTNISGEDWARCLPFLCFLVLVSLTFTHMCTLSFLSVSFPLSVSFSSSLHLPLFYLPLLPLPSPLSFFLPLFLSLSRTHTHTHTHARARTHALTFSLYVYTFLQRKKCIGISTLLLAGSYNWFDELKPV